jgi:Protein of unknown function (DUF3037)
MRFARDWKMTHSYNFSIIRLESDELRGERINIGALILKEVGIDLRLTRRMERVRAISAAVDLDSLNGLLGNLKGLDDLNRQSGITDPIERLNKISRVGPLSLSKPGTFVADTVDLYEQRVASLVKLLVEPEPSTGRLNPKKTRLFSAIKDEFKRQRILARRSEGLESHRVVAGVELADGLVADMILRNGAYHVIETVDASGDVHSFRKVVSDIGVAALVLERARMQFASSAMTSRLVFTASGVLERVARPSLDAAEHQGAELINWSSTEDRVKFMRSISALATPIEPKGKIRFVNRRDGGLFH